MIFLARAAGVDAKLIKKAESHRNGMKIFFTWSSACVAPCFNEWRRVSAEEKAAAALLSEEVAQEVNLSQEEGEGELAASPVGGQTSFNEDDFEITPVEPQATPVEELPASSEIAEAPEAMLVEEELEVKKTRSKVKKIKNK